MSLTEDLYQYQPRPDPRRSRVAHYRLLGSFIFCVSLCLSEMVSFLPIRGSVHRFVGAFDDPALGAASSFNYWLLAVTFLCLETNALTSVLLFWVDESHVAMLNILIPCLCLFLYFVLNIWDARRFGEAEYWVGLLTIITAVGLLVMSVFLICSANPHGDSFGFRY
ncbi:amino acid transmembrane transport protein [Malassezia pachydermatis]